MFPALVWSHCSPCSFLLLTDHTAPSTLSTCSLTTQPQPRHTHCPSTQCHNYPQSLSRPTASVPTVPQPQCHTVLSAPVTHSAPVALNQYSHCPKLLTVAQITHSAPSYTHSVLTVPYDQQSPPQFTLPLLLSSSCSVLSWQLCSALVVSLHSVSKVCHQLLPLISSFCLSLLVSTPHIHQTDMPCNHSLMLYYFC